MSLQLKINSKFLMLIAALAILFADPMIFIENTFCDDSLTLENSDSFFEEPEEKTEENAQDDFFSDDLKMLDIQTQSDIETEADNLSPSPWRFSGSMETGAGYNFAHDRPHANQIDQRGLSSLYAGCDLNVEYKLSSSWNVYVSANAIYDFAYRVQGRDEYPARFLDRYEKEIRLNKAFIQGTLTPNLDVKIGRQLVVWGKSDSIRITDVINPLNSLEPGLTDIEDLRIPVFMSRFNYYIKSWTISTIFIHEHTSSLMPVFGSDFYSASFDIKEADTPDIAIDDTGFALSISRSMARMDIAFYAARLYDNNPYLDLKNINGAVRPFFDHTKINMAGAALNNAHGNFLFKAEAAFLYNLRLSNLKEKYSRLDILGGLEYSGFSNTSISFEVADRWYCNLDRAAKNRENEKHNMQYAVRVSRTFINEILELSMLATYFGASADDGGFFRFKAEYDLTDSIKLSGGIIFYESGGNGALQNIGDSDRIFCSVKYSF